MPNTAITKNNAGVVEAIKRQSGSTKFYKPSFQGIIEAILDWQGGSGGGTEGGGGATVLPIGGTPPSTGNTAGDMVIIPNADGDYFIYVFAAGGWENIHVTTEEVEVAGSAPLLITAGDGTVLKNQKDVNEYLDGKIKELQELEQYDDADLQAALLQETFSRQQADVNLQLQINDLPVTVADDAPDGEDGDLWFDSTADDLQLFVNYGGQWVVASPPVSTDEIENSILEIQEILAAADALSVQRGNQIAGLQSNIYNVAAGVASIQDSLGKVTLQEVVENGNVADIPIAIQTEKGVSVIEDQCLRITHQNNPYIRLVDEEDGDALEITLDKDSGHIDLSDVNDSIHFKFAGTEQVTIKGNGDAEFNGRVKVQPGEKDNEAVTYGQLVTLEEEIEQLRPTWDRGQWEYSPESYAQEAKYVLIQEFLEEDAQENLCAQARADCMGGSTDPAVTAQCNREYDTCMTAIEGSKWLTTDDWGKVESIAFSKVSTDGTDHSFVDVEAGMMIDVFNINDDGFMVAAIDEKTAGPEGTGFKITLVQSRGKAGGPAIVKFFQLSEEGQEIELTNYVRKDGDDMTGPLTINSYTSDTIPALAVRPTDSYSGNSDVFKVCNKDGLGQFYVTLGGDIFAHSDWVPTKDKHLTTKKYVDAAVALGGSPNDAFVGLFKYRYVGLDNSSDAKHAKLKAGEFCYWEDGSKMYFSPKDLDNRKLMSMPTEDGELINQFFINCYFNNDYKETALTWRCNKIGYYHHTSARADYLRFADNGEQIGGLYLNEGKTFYIKFGGLH